MKRMKEMKQKIKVVLARTVCDPLNTWSENKAIEALKEPERQKEKWEDGEAKCPVGGEDKCKDLDADVWADWKPPFCPNCGADMRGEQE